MIPVLIVVEPFGAYARGAIIEDATEMAEVLESEHSAHVIKSQQKATAEASGKK